MTDPVQLWQRCLFILTQEAARLPRITRWRNDMSKHKSFQLEMQKHAAFKKMIIWFYQI